MAPRAYWKGYLRLSLVSCPVALFPATTDREKIRFHQINRCTGHRIKYLKVDAETGEPVDPEDVVKACEVRKGEYTEITDEELEAVALESRRIIEIDEFVPKTEIDDLYNIRPYYIAPDGDIGDDAFAVIRDVLDKLHRVALGRIVLTTREHIMAIEPRGKGMMGTLLRYPYEIRDAAEYFDAIADASVTKDMLDLAKHIVETRSGHFHPEKFEDHYEQALRELLGRKQAGERIAVAEKKEPAKVINLMDALRRSVEAERRSLPAAGRRPEGRRSRRPAAARRHRPARKAG